MGNGQQQAPQSSARTSNLQEKGIVLYQVVSDNPNAPILNGFVTIDGVEMQVALWNARDRQTNELRKDKNGNPYWMGKISPKQER